MKGIHSVVFKDVVDGKSQNLATVRSGLEAYGFSVKDEHGNVFDLRDLTKSVMVAVEDQKVILHAGFCRRIRKDALEAASCKLLELNAEHHLLLSVDTLDNEICCEYTFMLPASPLTAEAFDDVFGRYMQMIDFCEALIAKQLRTYFVGLLDEDETETILRSILRRRREHPRIDFRDIPLDDDDDDDDDDDGIGRFIDLPHLFAEDED